jgi:D-alanyl-D-alanine carboxypeptidase/D-alanyl-D-alanine-endopeptidase (penicillin-binding protein 4)
MPQRAGLIASVVALTVAAAAAAGGVLGGPTLTKRASGTAAHWRPGTTPNAPPAVLVGADGQAPAPTAQGVTSALTSLVSAPGLGPHVGVSVIDVSSGQQLFAVRPDESMVPASVTKLVTGITVLATRGPAYRIPTRVVAGSNPGEVVLVGGGDPTLAAGANATYPEAARLDDLANQVKQALGGTAPTKVIYDGSLFSGPAAGPGWDADATTGGYGSPITALMTDGARVNPLGGSGTTRYAQPDLAAAKLFAKQFGIATVTAGTAPSGAKELGKVESPPMLRMVEVMISSSDNIVAEMLARQVALARGQPGSFTGASTAMRSVLEELGVPVTGYGLQDGSGLSRLGRLSPALLTAVLTTAGRTDRPDLHGLFTGLPVAGYSGTLAGRYRTQQGGSSAAGEVRAKTGTLTGVSSIAGVVVDADGRALAFALIADANKSTPAAVEAHDRIAAAHAPCGCRH